MWRRHSQSWRLRYKLRGETRGQALGSWLSRLTAMRAKVDVLRAIPFGNDGFPSKRSYIVTPCSPAIKPPDRIFFLIGMYRVGKTGSQRITYFEYFLSGYVSSPIGVYHDFKMQENLELPIGLEVTGSLSSSD